MKMPKNRSIESPCIGDTGLAFLYFSLLVLSFVIRPAIADDTPSLAFHGFGTLGVVQTSSDQAEFVRDLSQPTGATNQLDGRVDSILGLQANWRMTSKLEAVVQAVSRYRYDKSFTPDISWAYLKYDPTPQVSLRAGRLGTEFFMTADSRLVGYSYLTVRPPGDFFWSLPFYSINGADATLTLPVGENLLRGKVYYGLSQEYLPYVDQVWDLGGSAMFGGYLDYQVGAWLLRASYANIRFHHNTPIEGILAPFGFPPGTIAEASSYLAIENTRSHYYSLGAIYDDGPWQIQLMVNKVGQGARIFQSSYGGYVLAGYRIGEVTPYLGYSWVRSQARNPPANPVIASVMADFHADQNTSIVGARWDVYRNLAIKAQWDAIRGEPSSIFPYRGEKPEFSGKMDVFSLTMDFVF